MSRTDRIRTRKGNTTVQGHMYLLEVRLSIGEYTQIPSTNAQLLQNPRLDTSVCPVKHGEQQRQPESALSH